MSLTGSNIKFSTPEQSLYSIETHCKQTVLSAFLLIVLLFEGTMFRKWDSFRLYPLRVKSCDICDPLGLAAIL